MRPGVQLGRTGQRSAAARRGRLAASLAPPGRVKGGGGVMSESKLFEELFVVVCVWKFLMQGGRVSPKSKLFEELFSLSLEFF